MSFPATISPSRLRVDRPRFRTHHTFPLHHTSEYVDSQDPLPLEWLHDLMNPSSPVPAVDLGHQPQSTGTYLDTLPPIDPALTIPSPLGNEEEQSESINHVDRTLDYIPRRTITPIPIRPARDFVTGGTTTTTSDSSVDTPLSERRKKNHQAFLARTRQYQATPTPHHPLSEARMLAATPTPSKRFLDGDESEEEEEEEIEMSTDGCGMDDTAKEGKKGDVIDSGSKCMGQNKLEEEEQEEEEEIEEVEETPIKSSPYKTSEGSDHEGSDDAYSPRRSAKSKRKVNRGRSRPRPYPITRTRTTRATKVELSPVPPTPIPTRKRRTSTPPSSPPFRSFFDEDATSGLRGESRVKVKVNELKKYLEIGPKRLREPRFDMKIFHWAMTGCQELKWQKNGQGVVIDDIDRFYKNVLYKEVMERKEQRGQTATKRDFPGKSSFERQLSGYGFSRLTKGKTVYINRPDLRRTDKRLLKEINRVWDEIATAVKVSKTKTDTKSEPTTGIAFLRKQNLDLEVLLDNSEREMTRMKRFVKGILTGHEPGSDDLRWVCDKLHINGPVLPRVMVLKSSPGVYTHQQSLATCDEPDLPPTPLKSIDQADIRRPAKKTRRNSKVKQENA